MTRQLLLSLLCGCALALPSFSRALADDLPLRKAGLWSRSQSPARSFPI